MKRKFYFWLSAALIGTAVFSFSGFATAKDRNPYGLAIILTRVDEKILSPSFSPFMTQSVHFKPGLDLRF
jgi:hypothetical protein